MPYSVYILRCSDGTYYCGAAKDLAARVKAHNSGKGAKYTRGRGPVRLVYSERKRSRGDALRRELEIKSLSREAKKSLVSGRRAGAKIRKRARA